MNDDGAELDAGTADHRLRRRDGCDAIAVDEAVALLDASAARVALTACSSPTHPPSPPSSMQAPPPSPRRPDAFRKRVVGEDSELLGGAVASPPPPP